jgi:hypothetical protein
LLFPAHWWLTFLSFPQIHVFLLNIRTYYVHTYIQ